MSFCAGCVSVKLLIWARESTARGEEREVHKGESLPMSKQSSWGRFAGQNDVQPALHVPMVYENVTASPQHWEYHTLSVDTREEALPDDARLSELGAQGWLLVSVLEPRTSESRPRVYYYFVRQKEA